jgi:hypothetical protein
MARYISSLTNYRAPMFLQEAYQHISKALIGKSAENRKDSLNASPPPDICSVHLKQYLLYPGGHLPYQAREIASKLPGPSENNQPLSDQTVPRLL